MGRLGESRLGTDRLGADTTTTTVSKSAPRRRAETLVKSPFHGTVWDKLLDVLAAEPVAQHSAIRELVAAHNIDTAQGAVLDKHGALVDVTRRKGERDAHYRKRIKLQLPADQSGATIPDIIYLSAILLDCHQSQIELHETPGVEAARFDILLDEQVITETDVTADEYLALIQDIKPAGVRALVTIGQQFTHRSVADLQTGSNDPDKAYNNAPYADIVTARYEAPDADEEPDTTLGGALDPSRQDGYGQDGYGSGPFGDALFEREYGEGNYGYGGYGQ
mgnify:CR=1 FL=1